jgi:hypothetical protein
VKIAEEIKWHLDQILWEDPGTVLDKRFAEFLSPWFTSPQSLHEAYGVAVGAHHEWDKVKQVRWQALLKREYLRAMYRRTERPAVPVSEPMSDEDLAALDDLI